MAGLSLRTGMSVGGSYTPMTPASASPSTANSSIAQAAYGVNGDGTNGNGKTTAMYGSITVGVLAVAGLMYLWWSLPH